MTRRFGSNSRRGNAHSRRGNAAVTAVSLGALLGFGALALDVSYVRVTNAQLQVAIEAGVLGGSGYLDRTVAGTVMARQKTVELVEQNLVFGGLEVTEGDVIPGNWDRESQTFEARDWPSTEAQAAEINAIRLDVTHNSISALLAGAVFGHNTLSTHAMATAVRDMGGPAGSVDCYLPIAVPHCFFDLDADFNPPPFRVYVQTDSNDNGAWAMFGKSANADDIRSAMRGECDQGAEMYDTANLNNGSLATVFNHALGPMLSGTEAGAEPWPYEHLPDGPPDPRGDPDNDDSFTISDSLVPDNDNVWGNVIGGPIALVDMGGSPGNCPSDLKFVGSEPIAGFTYGYIYDAHQGNAHTSGVYIQLDILNEYAMGNKTGNSDSAVGNTLYPPQPPVLAY